MTVTTVFFDMGGTLLDYHPPDGDWEMMEKLGAGGIYEALAAIGYALPDQERVLIDWWENAINDWRSLRTIVKEEMRAASQLRRLLPRWGIAPAEEAVIAAEEAYVRAIQKIVRPIEGALEAVKWMYDQGLQVGLISNTVWQGKHHQIDLEKYGFWPYFACTIFSSDALVWKPEKAIFDQGLMAFGSRREETIYVGDSLFFDVYGAQQAGWRAVWVEQERRWMPPDMDFPEPDATLHHIADLKNVLREWIME